MRFLLVKRFLTKLELDNVKILKNTIEKMFYGLGFGFGTGISFKILSCNK